MFLADEKPGFIEIAKVSVIYIGSIFITYFILDLKLSDIIETGIGTERFATGREMLQNSAVNVFTDWNVLCTAFLRTVGTDIVGVTDYVGTQNLLEAPAFYCGLFPLFMLSIACARVKGRKKVFYIIALVCASAYIIFVPIRFLANGLAGSETFKLSSFWIIVLIIYISAVECDGIFKEKGTGNNRKIMLVTAFILIVVLFMAFANIGGRINALYRTIVLIVLYTSLMILFIHNKIGIAGVKSVIFLLVAGEVMAMSDSAVNDRATVQNLGYDDGTVQALEVINDNDFWRVDKQYDSVFLCDSLCQGYMGTKAYIGGVADRQSTLDVYNVFGMPKTEMNRYLWGFSSSTKLNTIFNVKYILTRSGIIGNYGYEYLEEYDGIKIYKNKYALPLGYTYNNYILLEDFLKLDVEGRRNILYEACITEKPVDGMDMLYMNKEETFLDVLKDYEINPDIVSLDSGISITLNEKNDDITTVLKVVIDNNTSEILDVTCRTEDNSQSFRYGMLKGVNEYYMDFSDNGIIGIDMLVSDRMTVSDIKVYQLPSEKYYDKYMENCKKLAESSIKLNSINNNIISGTISCSESKIIVFSIPYDIGWHLYIDDIPADIQQINIGMMGAEISEGTHDVRLEYRIADEKTARCIAGFIIVICIIIGQKIRSVKSF